MSLSLVGLVPAAGRSERMGRPKLTLGLGNERESVIQRVVRALVQGGASDVVVVAPPIPDDAAVLLANQARVEGALVVHLDAPTSDMRSTVEYGLDAIEEHGLAPDGLLLTPGDFPGLTPKLVADVARRFQAAPWRIILPAHDGRRGHPLALPWALAREIGRLPPNVGVNTLLKAYADRVETFAVEDPGAVEDMDTPADYQRWSHPGGPGA